MRARLSAADLVSAVRTLIPRPDAEFLLMSLLRVTRHELYSGWPVPASCARRFARLARRAACGEPVQYLVKSAPFLDLDLLVDRRVLIPRPETEELVSRTIERSRGAGGNKQLTIVDYGTGSACIAIALARAFPLARVLAVDASRPALAVARQNIQRYQLGRRIRLRQVDSLRASVFDRLRHRVDLLVSNPPYVPTRRLAQVSPAVRREPKPALDGGPKGTNIVEMLLADGPEMLSRGGLLAMEIDWSHGPLVRRLAPGAEIEPDLSGRTRYAFIRRDL